MGDEGEDMELTADQTKMLHDSFHLFDKKGTGTVNINDLTQLFKIVGHPLKPDQLEEYADEADEDGKGHITFEQFVPIFKKKKREDENEKELREAFRVLDKNNRGVIDVEDLRWILKSLGDDLTDDEIEAMIQETDADGSGTVDYEEFSALMMG